MSFTIAYRIGKRKIINQLSGQKRKLEQDYCIPWFNPGFFNKWEVHQLLTKDESIKPLLPNTEAFQHFEQVERFLGTYKSVYMKPIHRELW